MKDFINIANLARGAVNLDPKVQLKIAMNIQRLLSSAMADIQIQIRKGSK